MSRIYIFDLDGTLADCSHRLHFIQRKKKDWSGFFKACADDKPIQHNIDLLQTLRRAGHEIWIWTGRSDEAQAQTEEWLYRHKIFKTTMLLHREPFLHLESFRPFESFRMRKAGDHRPDHEVKAQWLSEVEPPEYKRLAGVFEDRTRVVQMWREAGVPCFQVAEGDF